MPVARKELGLTTDKRAMIGDTIETDMVEVDKQVPELLSPLTQVQRRLLELWDPPSDLYHRVARGFPETAHHTSEPKARSSRCTMDRFCTFDHDPMPCSRILIL